jgi:serine/threonine protein kinase
MLLGVQHLHRCDIVHRDIKPTNLLLTQGDSLSNSPVVKVCDLGLSAKLPRRGGLTEICGTAPYIAPEILLNIGEYRAEVDLWSCGVTAHLLLLGDFPYKYAQTDEGFLDPSSNKLSILFQRKPTFKASQGFSQPSDAAIRFVASLLMRDKVARAGCRSALSSEYIRISTKPALALQPSLGPSLSIACDAARLQPAPEIPVVEVGCVPADGEVGGVPVDGNKNLSTDESTDCGSDDEPRSFGHISL